MRALLGGSALVLALLAVAVPARAATPSSGTVLANGSTVGGLCQLVTGSTDDVSNFWVVATVDPRRVHASGEGGDALVPATLPHLEDFVVDPNTLYGPSRQGTIDPGTSCGAAIALNPQSAVNGSEIALDRPGPYIFEQYKETVHWTLVADGDPPPPMIPCEKNDPHYPIPGPPIAGPNDALAPPVAPAGSTYTVDSFCNAVTVTQFSVLGDTGQCPAIADLSQFPLIPYINQYDAGAAVGLPEGSGKPGGNACGPSALLDGMQRNAALAAQHYGVPAGTLPGLPAVFDETMEKNAKEVKPGGRNRFAGYPNAVAFLKSLGWRHAYTRELYTDPISVGATNLLFLADAMSKGPVVVSTAFGSGRWGETGGGHMILARSVSGVAGVVVDDPAGGYFNIPKTGYSDTNGGHYGPGSCGFGVTYPAEWLQAMIAGRWFLSFGERSLAPVPAAAAAAAQRTAAAASTAADPWSGAAINIYDTHPGGADAPQDFYVEDAQGRRAGWIGGQAISEIPDADVAQNPAEWDDPAIGDPEVGGPPPEPEPLNPTPRSVSLADPQPGTTLHVITGGSGTFALTAQAWRAGARTASDTLSGTIAAGQDTTVASPALTSVLAASTPRAPPPQSPATTSSGPAPAVAGSAAVLAAGPATGAAAGGVLGVGRARLRGSVLSVPLTCSGSAGSSCRASGVLLARTGRRTVTIAHGSATLSGGRRGTLRLTLNAAGRHLIAAHRHPSATLQVTQPTAAPKTALVLRRRVRL